MHALAPWDPLITINWSNTKCRLGCTTEQRRANYAMIADYHLQTMEDFAEQADDPAQAYQRICDVAADECSRLGEWYKRHDRLKEAATAYRTFFDRAGDRVGASNGIEWLVRYYQKTGQAEQARLVAHAA